MKAQTPCSLPPPLTEDQISDVIDGKADSAVHYHLELCESCRTRLEEARRLERTLRNRFHPTMQQLGEYVLHLLEEADRHRIETHLQWCPRCRAEIEALATFLDDDDAAGSGPPSARQSPLSESRRSSMRQRQPALVSIRAGGDRGGDQPQILQVEDPSQNVRLMLRWYSKRAVMVGKMIPAQSWSGALVMCHQDATLRASVPISDSGEFKFEGLTSGATNLSITPREGRTVLLEGIVLPA